jgi:protein-tyrosine kinase
MSIIEKALSKMGNQSNAVEEVKPESTAAAAQAPLIEQAHAKSEAKAAIPSQPAPATAASSVALDTQSLRLLKLDLNRLRARGLLASDDERGHMAEEYRMIKRPLLANAFGPNPVRKGNMIMVTSALPGEGKSFSAINLAISIAMELDRTVLLVDADVAKPRLPEYLGFQAEHGLLDVLRQDVRDLSSVIYRTNIDKLSILPAGRTYARATELLASDAMDRLITDLANRYSDRLVLFDSPPLLVTSESSVLASHMGQIVMVVESGKTPKSALREALSRLGDACGVVGLLLNKSALPNAGNYYGYYGYGGYSKHTT